MTTSTIRAELMQSIKDLQEGRISVKTARAMTKQASQIIYSLRVDIENKRENIKLMKALSAKEYVEYKAKALQL